MSRDYRRGLRDAKRLLGRHRSKLEGEFDRLPKSILGNKTTRAHMDNLAAQRAIFQIIAMLDNDIKLDLRDDMKAMQEEAKDPS